MGIEPQHGWNAPTQEDTGRAGGRGRQADRRAADLDHQEVKPDLLVLDVSLPGMSGIELYDRVRKDDRLKNVPVMFETALFGDYRDEFKRRGIKAVVEKPFDVNDIVKTVHKLAPVEMSA
jgi:CheY-like chemotaxis protein